MQKIMANAVKKQKKTVNFAQVKVQKVDEERHNVEREFSEIQNFMLNERKVGLVRWNIQKTLLTETLRHFDYMRRNAIRTKTKRKKQEAWENYFKCDGVPHSFRPLEVLSYISKWNYEIENDMKLPHDWILERDELSVLTQDSSIVDRTLEKLKSQRSEFAKKIVERIREVEFILKGFRKALHIDSGFFSKADKVLLRGFRSDLHRNLARCIDIYTYEMLKNMERDMEPVVIPTIYDPELFSTKFWGLRDIPQPTKTRKDPTSLQHSFTHETFAIHLWGLRNVPQPKRTLSDRFKIPLDAFGGEASFPYTSAMEELAFRSTWTCYDHYSCHCPSYALDVQPAPIVDLLTAMIQEWTQRDTIDQLKITQLDSKRMEFEKSINTWAEDFEEMVHSRSNTRNNRAAIKDKGKQKEKLGKKVHTPKAIMAKLKQMDGLTFGNMRQYDSNSEFVANEDKEYIKQLKGMIPTGENLLEGDINLRSHQIVGGVFHLNYFPKPSVRRDFLIDGMVGSQNTPLSKLNYQTIKLDKMDSGENHPEVSMIFGLESPRSADILQPSRSNLLLPPAPSQDDGHLERPNLIDLLKKDEKDTARKTQYVSTRKVELDSRSQNERPSLIELLRRSELPRSSSEPPTEGKLKINDPTERLILVDFKIKLSSNVLWVGAPTVCYWEPWENSEEFQNFTESEQNYHLNREEYEEKLRNRLFKTPAPRKQMQKLIRDFDMLNIPKSIDFYELCKETIIPALPYHYKTYMETVLDKKNEKEMIRKKKLLAGISTPTFGIKTLTDKPPKAEPSLPKPLFVPRETYLNVIIASDLSDDEAKELILDKYKMDTATYDEKFTPPNILLSEFLNSIRLESELDEPFPRDVASALIEEHNLMNTSSITSMSQLISLMSTNKMKQHHKNKRSKVKHGSDLGRHLREDNRSTANLEVFDKEPINPSEYRGSLKYKQINHPKGRWCTRKISKQKFDEADQTISFQSPYFGAYALAMYRYHHMPFKSWYMTPNHGKFNHVTFTVTTPFISLEIHITPQGFILHIPYQSNIPIERAHGPLSLYDFKQMLQGAGLNIFPERDAANYIENISEKHLPTEHHTYYSMACFCQLHRFRHSPWNILSHRRRMVLLIEEIHNDNPDLPHSGFYEVLVTPNECYKTKISEECNLNLDDVKILYNMEPEEQEYQPDLFFLLKSSFTDLEPKDSADPILDLSFNVAQLLASIRPLSFS